MRRGAEGRPTTRPAEAGDLAEKARLTGLILTAGATVIVPAWAVFDHVLEPRLAPTFSLLRLACALPMALASMLLWFAPVGRRHPGVLTAAGLAVAQLEIGWMIPQVGHLEFYLLGGSLLLYASGALLATTPLTTVVLSAAVVTGMAAAEITGQGHLDGPDLAASGIFLGTAMSIGVLSHATRFRLLRIEVRARTDLQQEQRRSQELLAELRRLSAEDPLTGLANRRHWDSELAAACLRAEDGRGQVSLVLVDIDHFKAINDAGGHAHGDRVLQQVARVLVDTVRVGDLVARLGGDELAVLLPGVDVGGAVELAERVRTSVSSLAPGSGPALTVSLGVAGSAGRSVAPDALTAEADAQLYRAKSVRNAVASDGGVLTAAV